MADDRAVASAQGLHPARAFLPMASALATGCRPDRGAGTPILALIRTSATPVLAKSRSWPILGGLGSIGGATIAAFVVGVFEAYSSVYLGGSKGALALFVFVLVILVVRPTGLMGRVARRA
jgi:branched-chain amino acid transport system permease protein